MDLILVRHGESEYNLQNKFTGWKNVELTRTGEDEAKRAAVDLQKEKVERIFTSTLVRAQHTLKIIQNICGWQSIPVTIDSALNERSYGDLEGLNKTEAGKTFGEEQVHIWRRSYDVAPPGGESLKDTRARVIPYFKERILPCLERGETVLVVAHGNSLRALIMFLEELSPEQITSRELATCVPLIYQLEQHQLNAFSLRS